MRRLSAAIVVSVTSHAVALVWVVWSGNVLAVPHTMAPPIVPTETRPVAASESASIALVLLDPDDPRAASRREPAEVDDASALPNQRPPARSPARSPAQSDDARRDPRAEAPGETIVLGGTSRGAPPDKAAGSGAGEPAGEPGRSWLRMRWPKVPDLRGLSQGFVDDFLSHSKPRGADAYTASELAQLNAIRHSKAVFAPYE